MFSAIRNHDSETEKPDDSACQREKHCGAQVKAAPDRMNDFTYFSKRKKSVQ
jgi:hypothetical protein